MKSTGHYSVLFYGSVSVIVARFGPDRTEIALETGRAGLVQAPVRFGIAR